MIFQSIPNIQAALETVRCEELQLEFTSALKSKPSRTSQMQSSSTSSGMLTSTGGISGSLGQSNKYTTAASSTAISGISGLSSMMANNNNNITNNISGLGAFSSSNIGNSILAKPESSVTWAPTPDHQKSTEIDRIMAKIEQARLSIANVCVLIREESKISKINQKLRHCLMITMRVIELKLYSFIPFCLSLNLLNS